VTRTTPNPASQQKALVVTLSEQTVQLCEGALPRAHERTRSGARAASPAGAKDLAAIRRETGTSGAPQGRKRYRVGGGRPTLGGGT
jgi:hypothetical protein